MWDPDRREDVPLEPLPDDPNPMGAFWICLAVSLVIWYSVWAWFTRK